MFRFQFMARSVIHTQQPRFFACFATIVLLAVAWIWLVSLSDANPALQPIAASDRQKKSPSTDRPDRLKNVPPEFKQAGVCARCHVVSVLEWGISGHVESETTCQKCHGPSKGHVANERNEVKPDRLPRGKAIAKQLCSTCHKTGCPSTQQVQTCQKCHHVHALINPAKPPKAKDDRLEKLLARWDQYRKQMAKGDQHVKQQEWKPAQAAFREALKLIPGNHHARTRFQMCRRRLNPSLPGFRIVGNKFDAQTGLPRDVQVAELKIPMLLVPPGEFDMGSDELSDSRPRHTVRVDAFYLGRYEITQAAWKAVMGANPSKHQGKQFADAARLPVERVSWNDCQQFIRRLNKLVPGGGFRLPTEAEWEYACRAGQREVRFSGKAQFSEEKNLSERAWFRVNSLRKSPSKSAFLQIDAYAPRPVGTRRPNPWGFYDMQGNVCEWCSSLWRPYLYNPSDGRESLARPGMRILRGGSFSDSAESLNPALRHPERPHRRFRSNGLRLARSVPDTNEQNGTRKAE